MMQYMRIIFILCFSQVVWVRPAFAAMAFPNVSEMIKNIAETVPELMMLVTALAYVLGFFFVFNGIILLKKYSEQRTMMSSGAKMTPPLANLFVGAALIYLPSAVNSGLTTFWLNPTPYAYETNSSDEWAQFIRACFMIIQLIGVIAFIRGLVILTHLGEQMGQQSGVGRAIAHIIGGIFCIDMYDFVNAIFITLGIGPLTIT